MTDKNVDMESVTRWKRIIAQNGLLASGRDIPFPELEELCDPDNNKRSFRRDTKARKAEILSLQRQGRLESFSAHDLGTYFGVQSKSLVRELNRLAQDGQIKTEYAQRFESEARVDFLKTPGGTRYNKKKNKARQKGRKENRNISDRVRNWSGRNVQGLHTAYEKSTAEELLARYCLKHPDYVTQLKAEAKKDKESWDQKRINELEEAHGKISKETHLEAIRKKAFGLYKGKSDREETIRDRILEGMTYEAIGKELGISGNLVGQHTRKMAFGPVYKAIQKVMKIFGEE